MSSTRHAPPGAPLHQGRYASSPHLSAGLLRRPLPAAVARWTIPPTGN
ncbi:MAG: hypothetical protein IH623_09500 [Verrucomicrobia bacterium]|nr:hypothetical protein [Verrucomicrobiota bacterium]